MGPAVEPLYVRYHVPDLDRAHAFLSDFGMQCTLRDDTHLYMHGTGPAPFLYEAVRGESRFLGMGFRMASREALDRLADRPEASGKVELVDAPGAGWRVRLRMSGDVSIDAVWGCRWRDAPPPASPTPMNFARAKARHNASVRVARAPSVVHRLGHVVLHVHDPAEAARWLRDRFGLIPSDYMGPPGDPAQAAGIFLRVDRPGERVDHHCMLVLAKATTGVHHSAFEVEDLDSLMAGHDRLRAQRWQPDCGVGRHLLGSQIFDYWRDPFGFRLEHYTDGDVVDEHHRPTIYSGSAEDTTQWGARPPSDFFE